ncbi:hypothetical protein ACQKNX_08250 [Lysinibacillus sp. NPDC093712]|uniref:hypothetical protein n=1 Tax=Lysinibacillus sp. NPDC093712 TaxID=3390579 RepID=UPI003D00099A
MKLRNYFLLLLLCSSLFLVACTTDNESAKAQDSNEQEVDLTEFPTGVQSGDITVGYYNILMNTLSKQIDVSEAVKEDVDSEGKKELYREYLLYLNGLNYRPANDNEQEIDNYFSSFLLNTKLWAESRVKHLDTKSDIDNSVASNYFTDAKNDMLMTMEIMEKYNLSD